MPNYYTSVCFELPVELHAAARAAFDCFERAAKDESFDDTLPILPISEYLDMYGLPEKTILELRELGGDDDHYLDCTFDQGCICTGESADIDTLGDILQIILEVVPSVPYIDFEWGSSASRQVINAYGGGYVRITATKQIYLGSWRFSNLTTEQLEKVEAIFREA